MYFEFFKWIYYLLYNFFNQPNLVKEELIIQSFYDVHLNNNGEVITKKRHRFYNQCAIDTQNTKELIVDGFLLKDGYPFCKLYNAQIIRENRIKFDPQMRYGEDVLFLLSYLKHIKKLHFINTLDYSHTISFNKHTTIYSCWQPKLEPGVSWTFLPEQPARRI